MDSVYNGDMDELWLRPGFLLRRLNQVHHSLFYEAFSGDITPLQYGLLTLLALENSQDQSALCLSLGADRATLAKSLDVIKKKGWIVFEATRQDKRKKIVTMTKQGKQFLEESREKMRNVQLALLAPLSNSQKAMFIDMMKLLVIENNENMSIPMHQGIK